MRVELATRISTEIIDVTHRLNAVLVSIKSECPDEEFKRYRLGVRNALASIYLEVLQPLFAEYPSLEPPGWRRDSAPTGKSPAEGESSGAEW